MMKNLPKSLEDFILLCDNSKEVQEEVLKDILKSASKTEIGEKFDFKTIDSVDTFRTRMPVSSWQDVEVFAKRMQDGEGDLLFEGKPPFFVCTSGSTGKIKIIPESQNSKKLKSLVGNLRIEAIVKNSPSVMDGKIFPIVNHAIEGYTKAGIPYGSASGITLLTISDEIKNKVSFPMELLEIDYSKKMDYFLMRFAVENDVRCVFGNNAGRLTQLIQTVQKEAKYIIEDIKNGTLFGMEELAEDIQIKLKKIMKPNPKLASFLQKSIEEKGSLLPEAYWPNLKAVVCWLSGSVGQYVKTLKPFLSKDILLFDFGYGATEGKFNIPTKPDDPLGILSIFSVFYEFKEIGSDEFLMAHELKNNTRYEMYVTTYSGLYRYDMQDIIYVDGFVGSTPKIVFQSKAGEMLNLCGEKVSASSLIAVVNKAVLEVTDSSLVHWCIVPNEDEKYYHFYIEVPSLSGNIKDISQKIEVLLEKLLQSETLIYPIFREQKLLQSLKLTLMKEGWQEALYKEQTNENRSRTQVKLPLIYEKLPKKEFCFE